MDNDNCIEQIFKDIYDRFKKLDEITDLPFGVLDSEVRILMFFMFKCIVNDSLRETNFSPKKLQNPVYNNILNSIQADINQLFKINKLQIQYTILTRIRFYENIFKGKLYETDKLNFNSIKDKIIYTSSFVFYVLCADKVVFEKSNVPFAGDTDIKNRTILQRNENYKKYGNLDKFHNDYNEILHNLYDMIYETSKEQIEAYKNALLNEQIVAENEMKEINTQINYISDAIGKFFHMLLAIGIVLFILLVIGTFILYVYDGITEETNKANYNKERNEIISQLLDANKENFANKKYELNDKFITLKKEYMAKYFNNNEDELYETLDKEQGVTYYTLIKKQQLEEEQKKIEEEKKQKEEAAKLKTGIIKSTIPTTEEIANFNISARGKDLGLFIRDRNNNNSLTLFVKQGEKLKISIPFGAYEYTFIRSKQTDESEENYKKYLSDVFSPVFGSLKQIDLDYGKKYYFMYDNGAMQTMKQYSWENFNTIERQMPKTGIIKSTIVTDGYKNVHILAKDKNLYAKFINTSTEEYVIILVRKNSKLQIHLPNGNYNCTYVNSDVWYDIKDVYDILYKTIFTSTITIDEDTPIYLGSHLEKLSLYFWKNMEKEISELNN